MNALSVSWSLPSPVKVPRGRYLRLVAQRRARAARTPFVVVVALLLVSGLLGLLVLNTVLAQDAFRLHALQVKGHALADREQALQRQVSDLQSPQALAARATSLGMVPGGSPTFLRLSDGKVLGRSEPAVSSPPITAAPVAAAPAAKPKSKPNPAAPADGGWTVVRPGSTKGSQP